jgi:hypothetical protein
MPLIAASGSNSSFSTPAAIERGIRINSFMQNKPNFLETQMNISSVKAKHYAQKPSLHPPAKQTQFKPNFTNYLLQKKLMPKPLSLSNVFSLIFTPRYRKII